MSEFVTLPPGALPTELGPTEEMLLQAHALAQSVKQGYVAYCDGACHGNGAKRATPGGWGVLLMHEGRVILGRGGSPDTTNNQMELQGAIAALKHIPALQEVVLRTDSQYVVKGCTEWRKGWQRNGMVNSKKEPVANADLWLALWAEADRRKVKFEWVRGHNGDIGNEVADRLATTWAKQVR